MLGRHGAMHTVRATHTPLVPMHVRHQMTPPDPLLAPFLINGILLASPLIPPQVALELAASAKVSEAMLVALSEAIPGWLQMVQVGDGGLAAAAFTLSWSHQRPCHWYEFTLLIPLNPSR